MIDKFDHYSFTLLSLGSTTNVAAARVFGVRETNDVEVRQH
jgi:hypothetical protein